MKKLIILLALATMLGCTTQNSEEVVVTESIETLRGKPAPGLDRREIILSSVGSYTNTTEYLQSLEISFIPNGKAPNWIIWDQSEYTGEERFFMCLYNENFEIAVNPHYGCWSQAGDYGYYLQNRLPKNTQFYLYFVDYDVFVPISR